MISNDEATGPCVGCGETNHTAHHVSICAACVRATREARGAGSVSADNTIWPAFTRFEAAMALCALAVAKSGKSQFEPPDAPLRRTALEGAYKALSEALGVADA